MTPREDATAIFLRFRAMPRSEQIATEFALTGIMAWAKRAPAGWSLDYGAGLGTVSAAFRVARPLDGRDAVERDDWFRARLFDREPHDYTLGYQTLAAAVALHRFQVVVIDDGADTYDLGTLAMKGLAPRAAVIFEGNRPCERGAIMAMLDHVRRPHCHAEWKPADRAKGYHVVLCDPRWWERAWFLGVRLREAAVDMVARWRGVVPGWRRRGVNPDA